MIIEGDIKNSIDKLPQITKSAIEDILKSFPDSYANTLSILKRKRNKVLLYSQDYANEIYILLIGSVNGMTVKGPNGLYNFASFEPLSFFGESEAFSNSNVYQSTLICSSDCELLRIPRFIYLEWIKGNPSFLYERTCAITSNLLIQARSERNKVLRPSNEKMVIYLLYLCKKNKMINRVYQLKIRNQELADAIGCSYKSVQRSLSYLEEMNALTREGRIITIKEEQYSNLVRISMEDEK